MSATTARQSTMVLTFVRAALQEINDNEMMEELKEKVEHGQKLAMATATLFPEDGNHMRNFLWCKEKFTEIRFLTNHTGIYSVMDLITVSEFTVTDLLEEVTDPRKRCALDQLRATLKEISDALDPDGTAYGSFETIDDFLKAFYWIIGFKKEGRYLKHQEKLKRRAKRNGGN